MRPNSACSSWRSLRCNWENPCQVSTHKLPVLGKSADRRSTGLVPDYAAEERASLSLQNPPRNGLVRTGKSHESWPTARYRAWRHGPGPHPVRTIVRRKDDAS
jgi:hypothetical protein